MAGRVRTVGVLALQGDFREHVRAVEAAGARAREVRLPTELAEIDALILPGGESTVMRRLLADYGLDAVLGARVRAGLPVFGTCAGAILLARDVDGESASPLGVLDIGVSRNAYGSQVDSFESTVAVPALGAAPVPGVFIRAPRIVRVGDDAEVLGRLDNGEIVAVRQGSRLATTFHPELTEDTRFHRYFLSLVDLQDSASGAA